MAFQPEPTLVLNLSVAPLYHAVLALVSVLIVTASAVEISIALALLMDVSVVVQTDRQTD